MKKNNLILLIVVVALISGGAVYFLTNMQNSNQKAQQPEEQGFPTEPGAGEPSNEEPPAATEDDHDSPIEMGKAAPDFTLYDMDGNETSLSEYKGKMVFLNFWATWCQYCDIEMPDLQKVHKENDDLVVLAVNVREDIDHVKDYLDEGGYDFPVMLDEDGEIASLYLVSGMPTTYFINSDGVILGYQPGMMTLEQMEDILGQMRELEGQL
ncbi:MAG: TlpA family protein disulfide reductase [Bacillota bacterium]